MHRPANSSLGKAHALPRLARATAVRHVVNAACQQDTAVARPPRMAVLCAGPCSACFYVNAQLSVRPPNCRRAALPYAITTAVGAAATARPNHIPTHQKEGNNFGCQDGTPATSQPGHCHSAVTHTAGLAQSSGSIKLQPALQASQSTSCHKQHTKTHNDLHLYTPRQTRHRTYCARHLLCAGRCAPQAASIPSSKRNQWSWHT